MSFVKNSFKAVLLMTAFTLVIAAELGGKDGSMHANHAQQNADAAATRVDEIIQS